MLGRLQDAINGADSDVDFGYHHSLFHSDLGVVRQCHAVVPRDPVAEHTTERWQLPDKRPARAASGPKGPVRLGYLSMPDSRDARKPKCAKFVQHDRHPFGGIKKCVATLCLLDIVTEVSFTTMVSHNNPWP